MSDEHEMIAKALSAINQTGDCIGLPQCSAYFHDLAEWDADAQKYRLTGAGRIVLDHCRKEAS